MIEEELAVTAALADVVDATMRPELPFVARPLVEAINLATVEPAARRACAPSWASSGDATAGGWCSPRAPSSGALCQCFRAWSASSPRRAAPTGAWQPLPE